MCLGRKPLALSVRKVPLKRAFSLNLFFQGYALAFIVSRHSNIKSMYFKCSFTENSTYLPTFSFSQGTIVSGHIVPQQQLPRLLVDAIVCNCLNSVLLCKLYNFNVLKQTIYFDFPRYGDWF